MKRINWFNNPVNNVLYAIYGKTNKIDIIQFYFFIVCLNLRTQNPNSQGAENIKTF